MKILLMIKVGLILKQRKIYIIISNLLNSSLQIIDSCKELKRVLDSYTNIHSKLLTYKIKNIINTILNCK